MPAAPTRTSPRGRRPTVGTISSTVRARGLGGGGRRNGPGAETRRRAPPSCRAAPARKRRHPPLLWRDQVPPVLAFNPYVASGYRAGLSRGQCLASVCGYLHNETANIWSHLVPLLALAVYVGPAGGWRAWPGGARGALWHYGPPALCMAGSVLYHTLAADHPRYARYLAVDVCGVFGLATAGAVAVALGGVPCAGGAARSALASACTLAALAALVAAARASTPAGRGAPLLALLAARGAALAARAFAGAGPRAALFHYCAAEALSATGAVLNVMRLPEKLWPPAGRRVRGRFDFCGNSHNLMHAFALAALAHYHVAARGDAAAFAGRVCA